MARRRSSIRASASLRKLPCASVSGLPQRSAVQMAKLLLLSRDLHGQALAQVARAHARRVQMPHQIDGAMDQIERCRRSSGKWPFPAAASSGAAAKAAANSSSLAVR